MLNRRHGPGADKNLKRARPARESGLGRTPTLSGSAPTLACGRRESRTLGAGAPTAGGCTAPWVGAHPAVLPTFNTGAAQSGPEGAFGGAWSAFFAGPGTRRQGYQRRHDPSVSGCAAIHALGVASFERASDAAQAQVAAPHPHHLPQNTSRPSPIPRRAARRNAMTLPLPSVTP